MKRTWTDLHWGRTEMMEWGGFTFRGTKRRILHPSYSNCECAHLFVDVLEFVHLQFSRWTISNEVFVPFLQLLSRDCNCTLFKTSFQINSSTKSSVPPFHDDAKVCLSQYPQTKSILKQMVVQPNAIGVSFYRSLRGYVEKDSMTLDFAKEVSHI